MAQNNLALGLAALGMQKNNTALLHSVDVFNEASKEIAARARTVQLATTQYMLGVTSGAGQAREEHRATQAGGRCL
jgi:hypothetical protein